MTSGFASALLATFSFRSRPVTVLALLLYVAVFVVLSVTDQLAPVPGEQQQHKVGVDLEEAYQDLHTIAARPHPYNSRQNDHVRAYLLDRLNGIAKDRPFVHVLNDSTTVGFLDGKVATYFQGNNILVKVDGLEVRGAGSGVLLSAHFDSVSTAPGATDDGMNIASLLQVVTYLSKNQPRRTAIFNFNNGEEDGLHGAHSFLEHPWANLTDTFVNFEGAGAGGRPFLFRANSLPILRAFTHEHVPHPHANAISADAFAMRVIRSETDYAVYAGAKGKQSGRLGIRDHGGYTGAGGGMRGADVAFYQHRARYHTPEDSIRAMGREGARRALWASMEVVRGAGSALLDTSAGALGEDVVGDAEPSTFFELFGTYLIAFPLRTLLAFFIVLLVVGPIILLAFAFFLYRQTVVLSGRWVTGFRGYGRFWLALVISAAAHAGLNIGYLKLNPYTAHANSPSVVATVLSLSYLSFVIPLTTANYVRPIPPAKQKFAILLEVYFVTWVFLVATTVLVGIKDVSGLYWVGTWNASALIAAVLAMVEGLVGRGHAGREIVLPSPQERDIADDHQAGEREEEGDEASTEHTPLLGRRAVRPAVVLDETVQDQSPLWWIAQMLFSIPVPVYQIGALMQLWIQSMAQTAPDGGWAGITYVPLSIVSILVLLPLAPYAHKLHVLLTTLVLLIFTATTLHAWLAFPFDTSGARLKVWFSSRVELANLTAPSVFSSTLSAPAFVSARTELSAVPAFAHRAVAELPSSSAANASLACGAGAAGRRRGLVTCGWSLGAHWYPSVVGTPTGTWLHASVTRVNASRARFAVRGEGTRGCRVATANRNIVGFRARTAHERKWTEFALPSEVEGVRELRLWSRTWDDAFEVEVEFREHDAGRIEGSVACGWAEYAGGWYAGGFGGGGSGSGAQIPALAEALAFLPEWATVTKIEDGLVTAESGFVLD